MNEMRLITVLVLGGKGDKIGYWVCIPSVSGIERRTTVLLNSEQLFSPADVLCMKSSSFCDPVLGVVAANPRVKCHTDSCHMMDAFICRALFRDIHLLKAAWNNILYDNIKLWREYERVTSVDDSTKHTWVFTSTQRWVSFIVLVWQTKTM